MRVLCHPNGGVKLPKPPARHSIPALLLGLCVTISTMQPYNRACSLNTAYDVHTYDIRRVIEVGILSFLTLEYMLYSTFN